MQQHICPFVVCLGITAALRENIMLEQFKLQLFKPRMYTFPP